MRLGSFTLERYGPFEHLSLPFDPAPSQVNMIVAPNGFGKSVIRRAVQEFLFGIEARTPMTFRYGTERMLLRADIDDGSGTRSFVRRKGNGNTLSLAGGAEFPPDDTRRLLGGADEKAFRELFGLDTELLRSGGEDLIRSQGRLGQVLFAAGGGLGRVRDLLADLERKRDELGLATRRTSTRPIWKAFGVREQAVAELRKAALRPDGWTALERKALEAAQALKALLDARAEDARDHDGLRTVRACRPWIERLHQARQTLQAYADAPELDDTFEQRWRGALEKATVAASAATSAEAELSVALANRAGMASETAWLAAEADIKALGDLRGLALGAEADLPRVTADRDEARAAAAGLRRDLGWHDAQALPAAPAVKDAQRRLQAHPRLGAGAEAAAQKRQEAQGHLSATQADLDALPVQGDVARVADLAALLRAGGAPAARLDTAARKVREAEAALRTALAAVPDAPMPETALDATAAPSEARLEAAGRALAEADSAHQAAVKAHAQRTAEIATEAANLASLERTASLPPENALADARSRRDAIWAGLLTLPPDAGAAVEFDRALRQADEIADTLIRHGNEAARAATIRARLADLRAALANDARAVSTTETALADARHDIGAMAQAAGGSASGMEALRAFLRARDAAMARRHARDQAVAELRAAETNLLDLGRPLADALGVAPPPLPELDRLLAEADRRTQADRDLAARRKALTDQAARQRIACAAAEAEAAKAAKALADWHRQWDAAAGSLARPAHETLAATADALARIEELRRAENKAADDQRRIDDMRGAIAALATRIGHLAHLSAELAALPPIEAAAAFLQRLQLEKQEMARCADADKRVEQAEKNRAKAVADAAAAALTLQGLRAALRADTDDAAEAQLKAARAVAAARASVAEAEKQLALQGGGPDIERLTERTAETTDEADRERLAEIERRQHDRLPLIEAARDARNAADAAMARAGTGTDAADAATRREAAQAELARLAEEALVLHATRSLLQAALDRQSSGADQPLLARIGAVFRTITGGAQAGVRIEDARDGQTMVALEADGVTRKALDQLSEGTSDQLFLALRIAALEDYARQVPPLPFIADDILQTFDDARTAATLRALLGLSEQVQVIVLTHHPHVGDIAEAMGVHVMRLAA